MRPSRNTPALWMTPAQEQGMKDVSGKHLLDENRDKVTSLVRDAVLASWPKGML